MSNISAESWHAKMNKGAPSNPRVWDFAEKVTNECEVFVDNFRRYQQGVRITRARPVTKTQLAIQAATLRFEQDGDLERFMRRCRHLAGKKVRAPREDSESYEASQASQPASPPATQPTAASPPAPQQRQRQRLVSEPSQPESHRVPQRRQRLVSEPSQPEASQPRRNVREPAPFTPRATRSQRRREAIEAAREAVQREEEEGDGNCNVCTVVRIDQARPTIILPCGHGGTCPSCIDTLMDMETHCPVCRTKIENKLTAFIR